MNERPLYFGPDNGLMGLLTMPDEFDAGRPAALLLNAGLLHRVGPNRLNVELARTLAQAGFPALRFDMAGVGDSELQVGGMLDIERSRQDVVEAMNAVEAATTVDRFVPIGLCTGAYNAFRAALIDERVSGAVLIDGYSYPTTRSKIRHYRRRIFQLDRWVGYVARRLGTRSTTSAGPDDLIIFENEHVSRERFGAELGSLIDRRTDLLMLYTEMGPLAYNYREQLEEAFPELDLESCAQVEYYEATDHTFTLPGNRARAIGDIVDWMNSRYAVARSGAVT